MSTHITPPPVKIELHAYGKTYDVSNSLLDWQENEVVLSRKDTSGVYMEVTFPFKFVLDAYDIVEAIFGEYGFRAKADMYIYLRKNDWTYDNPAVFNLDFSTYEQSDAAIEINSRRSDLYEHLKEKESVNFDIPAGEVKESLPWNNERIVTENSLTESIYAGPMSAPSSQFLEVTRIDRALGISYLTSEIFVTGIIEEKTVGDSPGISNDMFFLEAKKDVSLIVEFELSGRVSYRFFGSGADSHIYIGIFKKIDGETYYGYNAQAGELSFLKYGVDIGEFKRKHTIQLSAGEKLYFMMSIDFNSKASGVYEGDFNITGKIKLTYLESQPAVNLDVINPQGLLQKLADKITDTETYAGTPPYPATIEDFNTNDQDLTMLVAAESIRGFGDAKVHTSYKDFKEWMATQGYEPFVNGNQLTFRKREKSFNKNLTAIELTEEDCADLKISVDNDYLFSGLKIGYKKKDYENTNGRFEFNGQHDYTSDYTGNSKVLELVSPYRADGYGIEFLAQEQGKDTTDDKSDKDMFIVNVKKESNTYKTIHGTMTSGDGTIPKVILDTLFNAKFNPLELLKMNANLLGASVNKLKFTASDANKDITINGERLDSDYTIPEEAKLFDAITYDFANRNILDLPSGDNINGLVKIHYRGREYEGFIKEISKNPAWETETQWVLLKK